MEDIYLSNISVDIESDQIILNYLNNLDQYDNINIKIHKLNRYLYKLDVNRFKIILKNCKLKDIIYIYKNSINDEYLNEYFNFWDNKYCLTDFSKTIKLLNQNNLLNLINNLSNVNFKLNICKLNYFHIKLIYEHIKKDNIKLKLLINSIDESYLIGLIDYFDDESIKFLNLNYNFIFRLNQISLFTELSTNEVEFREVTKLQIILLLGTSNEIKIRKKILKFNTNFIKLIINHVSANTFTYVIKRIQLSSVYELIDHMSDINLILLLSIIGNDFIYILCLKLSKEKLYKLMEYFTLGQFINSLYYISDEKIECLRNMSNVHKSYMESLFNTTNFNLYEEYFSCYPKQIIFALIQTNVKDTILNNSSNLNINTMKLIFKYLNFDNMIVVLNKLEINNRIDVILSLENYNFSMISNFIDEKLVKNIELNYNEKINFTLFNNYIDLNLSEHSENKIKNLIDISELEI